MELSYISRTCAPACHPLQPPQKGLQRWPFAATTRGLRQPPHLPCCAQDFLPNLSCISRKLLSISRLAFLPVPPFSRRQKASSATCARPTRPHRRPSPATRLPSCAENFSAQSLVHLSYTLLHLSYTLARLSYARSCLCPPPRDHAGGLRQPPFCRHAPKTFFAQSLVNSRVSLLTALTPVPPLQPPPIGFQRAPCPAPAATPAAFACRPLHLALADPILDRDRKMAGNLAEWLPLRTRYCYQRDCILVWTPSEPQFTGKKSNGK